ncbi:PD-(D/E)XK nuclease family protein [Candidatus Woesearchaeota archaeon]|nr:MAG: hypothetical protein QS99_C0008G0029 [archaeon GW2011_AR4]MBS3129672.1 PD-(D/E)XK nuclease family protein [Candidatus Woesearchaeota archaeon]HIH38776.1 PD-(D/E)XK nuclease family protein [Candidatus Woesearchaeota archaeon]HIJ03334.1 PD-(D/E)XK nuclease family protein [Candidatus Woesearchaeota archaeon]
MTTYSHSKLSTFEQCPLKYKFGYIDKVETEIGESVEAFLGKRVHESLEKLYKDLKFQKMNSLKDMLAFYNEEWTKNWNDGIVIVRDEYDPENYRKMGEKFITDYYNRCTPFNHTRTIGLETQNFVDINGYKIHVRIDRLALASDEVYEIHDYKTSNTLPTQSKLDQDRQLAVYAYGVKTMYPDAKKVKLIWHFLAFDKEMSSERTDEQLEKLKGDVLESIKEIEQCKEYPARESTLCEWCEFQPLCPLFRHKFEVEEKKAKEFLKDDGVKLVNLYASLYHDVKLKEEKLEEVREELVAYAKQHDIEVVFGSDMKVSVKSYPKLSFPKKEDKERKAFFDAVRKIGLWDKLAVVDVYELAKMINNKEIPKELLAILEKYVEKGETVRVSLRGK